MHWAAYHSWPWSTCSICLPTFILIFKIQPFFNENDSVSCLVVSNSLQPVTVAYQAPLSMEFPRQEYCNGLPCPPPGDLSDPGIKSGSPTLQADSLPFKPSKKPNDYRHFLPPPSRGCSLKDASLAKWWHSLVLGGGYALVYIFFLPSSLCVITQNN